MKHISIFATSGLVVVGMLLGMGIGYYITPEYKLSMYWREEMDLGVADRSVDLRYINRMATHHQGAILLAEQAAQASRRQEIIELAAMIQKNEPVLIEELYRWKKSWYNDSRKAPRPIVARLGPAGETFDLRFLNALIAHHTDGIAMTDDILKKSSRAEVLDNANAVKAFLTRSRNDLEKMRKDWYNI